MPTTVELGFDLSLSGAGDFFTLNDATKGALNGSTFRLAGDVLVDVTSKTREVTVRRGRSRTLEKFTAGLAQVVLDNRGRDFDPTYVAQQATRTNLVTNPSFESDASDWSSAFNATLSRSTENAAFGSASLKCVPATANVTFTMSSNLAVIGSTNYIFSAYLLANSTFTQLQLYWRNAANVVIADPYLSVKSIVANAWSRQSWTFTSPANAAFVQVLLVGANNVTYYYDGALLETGSTLLPYFDGSVSDNSIRFSSRGWTGTANASTSTITYWVPGTGSPYSGSIVPRKQVSISRDGKPIYTGNVEGWSWDYDLSGDATAEVRAVDGFASLAQADMTAGTAPGSTPGARIGTALTYAGWPTAQRNLATGNAVLDADVIAYGVNVLQYIQKVEASEPGAFFMSRDGVATFLSRADLQNPTSGNVTFGSGGVPVVEFAAASLTDEMKNAVSVTFTAGSVVGGTATSSDATSIASYGQFDYTLDTVLSGSLQAQRLADWLVSSYKDPKYQIDSVSVLLDSLTTMQQGQVLDLELGDVVTVAMSLPNINAVGTAVSQLLSIDAIEHQISVDRHFVTFTMSETTTGFVLDSASFGVLNTSQLGF